jgi:hypothetical protein
LSTRRDNLTAPAMQEVPLRVLIELFVAMTNLIRALEY